MKQTAIIQYFAKWFLNQFYRHDYILHDGIAKDLYILRNLSSMQNKNF